MPMMKKKFVPKKKSVKKPLVKKGSRPGSSGLARATTALATVATHHNKLLTSLFDKLYLTYNNVNEEENVFGGHTFNYNSSTGDMPCHIYDLTAINNEGGTALPMFTLKRDASGNPFISNANSKQLVMSANDGSGWNPNQSINKTILEYYNIKLELMGRETHKTKYNIALMQFPDADLNPLFTAAGGNTKHNQFWNHWVRPYVTNSMMARDSRVMSDLKGKFRILWQKDYELSERKSYNDELPHRLVNIYKKVNKLLKYNGQPVMSTTFQDDNPQTQDIGQQLGSNTVQTDSTKRIYLVITCNQTKDEFATGYDQTTGVGGVADRPTYNIWWRTKYIVPAIGV